MSNPIGLQEFDGVELVTLAEKLSSTLYHCDTEKTIVKVLN